MRTPASESLTNPPITMNMHSFLAPLATAALVLLSAPPPARAQAAPPPLQAQNPIPVTPQSYTWRDFEKEHLAWASREMLEPLKKNAAGQPWGEEAIAFARDALDVWAGRVIGQQTPELTARGRKLIDSGCDDPLIGYLWALLSYFDTDNWSKPAEDMEWAFRGALEAGYSPAVARLMGVDLARLKERGRHNPGMFDKTLNDLTSRALAGEAYRGEDAKFFVNHLLDPAWKSHLDRQPQQIIEICQAAKELPAWARDAVIGAAEVKLAWKARGGSWASKVTEEGWKGFREHLGRAREPLTRSWQARPDRPEAATAMITVVTGGAGAGEETERLWFDRAVAAHFDYYPAYVALMWALRPRWGGSHAEMLAFGLDCKATERYDTYVPIVFIDAINDISSELPDWRPFLRQPQVAAAFMEVTRKALAEPTRAAEREKRTSYLAVNAWMSGDFATAANTLRQIGFKLHPMARQRLAAFKADPETFMSESLLLGGPQAAVYAAAEQAREKGDTATAERLYQEVIVKTPEEVPAAAALPRRCLAELALERQLGTGEWVSLTAGDLAKAWQPIEGKWTLEENELRLKGEDKPVLIVSPVAIRGDFEMRGEMDVQAPANCCRHLDVVVGYQPELATRAMYVAARQAGGAQKWIGAIQYHGEDQQLAHQVPKAVEAANKFVFRSEGGRFSLSINGQSIFDQAEPKEQPRAIDDGRVGFGGYNYCAKNRWSFRNIEVRRLKAGS